MSKDIGLSEEQARQAWVKGFESAASLCQDTVERILSSAVYHPETVSYCVNKEALESELSKVKDGMYTQMRVAQKVGLDYYLAQTSPKTILEEAK